MGRTIHRASDISRKKKVKFRGIFRCKFAEKSANFAGFSREKSQNSQKSRPISQEFSGKKSNYEGFSGANSKKNRPISREISGGNFAKKQSVKKQPISLDFFSGANLAKIDQFCVDMTSVF